MSTIIENNKRLAEFLHGKDAAHPNQYHENWNELMQVVEKIEKENVVCFKIQGNNCIIEGNFKYGITAPTKIEAVYKACSEFVKWYNSAKQN